MRARSLLPGPCLARPVALLGILAACSDATSPEAAPSPAEILVPRGRLEAHVRTLAHDSMCGRLVGTAYERMAASYIADEFAAAGIAAAGTDGYFQTVLGPIPLQAPVPTTTCAADPVARSQNVIGALAGRGALAAQWVVVGAHYDHLGWGASNGDALVFNGADDNASGTAVMLEVARALGGWIAAHANAAPASYRSVMFHGYGAEEVGLVGSEQYAATPTVPSDGLYGVVNLDMVGRLRNQTLTVAGSNTAPGWTDLIATSRPAGLTIVFSDESLHRSDQWSFISLLGVPGLHLFSGTHEDYHTTRDDPPLLNYDGMQTVARLALGLVWELMTAERGLEGGSGGT
jgi:Zn-dependent M28 family amino/carboxypeptidase